MDSIVVRRDPRRSLTLVPSLFDEIDRFASGVWNGWTPTMYYDPRGSMPMDMFEQGDDLVVRAELPGFQKEDIDLNLEGDELTLKATRKQDELPEGAKGYLCELCHGEHSRTVTLPFPVDSEKISACFENGLLEIRLPKTEEAKPKHIEVKVK